MASFVSVAVDLADYFTPVTYRAGSGIRALPAP
jgi:hypothetical protein